MHGSFGSRRLFDVHGRREKAQPGSARVRPGGAGGVGGHLRFHRRQGRISRAADIAPHCRTRPRRVLPRLLGRRQRQYPRSARLARSEQQCHRAVQGRHPLSPERHRKRAQIPRARTDVQECADRAADGRRQGRVELQPQGQERARDHALLPKLHDRAVSSHRRRHRRARGRHRRRRPRNRLHVRPV